MIKITSTNDVIIVEGDELTRHYPNNGTLVIPKNSTLVLLDEKSEMVLFKSASNYDTLFTGILGSISIEDEIVTRENIIEKFNAISNVNVGGNVDLFEVVQSLPTENISDNKVYLVMDSNGSEGNTYVEYLYVNGQWEELGKFKVNIDLSGYATEDWVNSQGFLKEHQDISNLATKAELNTKQDTISDLETIRSGAALGATALQTVPSEYATEQWVNEQGFLKEHQDISNLATKEELATKQDVITDLETIRSGAAKGATALQSVPSTYAKKTDILTAKTDTRYTTFEVQNPVLSGKTILLQNEVTDSRKYHTLGFDKTTTVISNGLLNHTTPLYRDSNEYNCPQWDGSSIRFTYQSGNEVYTTLKIPYTYNGMKYVTHLCINVYNDSVRMLAYPYSDDGGFPDYQIVKFKESEIYNTHSSYGTLCIYVNGEMQNYDSEPYSPDFFDTYVRPGDTVEIRVFDFPLTTPNGALIIETPRFYLSTNNVLTGDVPTEEETSNVPERLNDYIRYSNNVKAYILTDKNTTFKTINGQQITGNGDITIDTNVDLSNYATKSELATKQNTISDLDAIRSGASKGATALQSVPDTYALKSEIPDITSKQDTLVSGTNIKTVNGTSLLGSGNIEINASADNVPTVQTTKQGTTNNYIYSSGQNDKYGVISDFYTAISYEENRASIHTDWYYWGNTDEYMVDGSAGWSINVATTSQAGLMSASDKSKLDGIDLSTKQDTLVSGTNIKTVNGTSLLGSGNIEISTNVDLSDYATKEELNAKQDVITDLQTIRSGAEKGATALQSVPDTYALKSEIPDISTKQDTLISGTNIKTVNGNSLLGSGNIEVAKEWIGTQSEYDALPTKDNNTTYYITE